MNNLPSTTGVVVIVVLSGKNALLTMEQEDAAGVTTTNAYTHTDSRHLRGG